MNAPNAESIGCVPTGFLDRFGTAILLIHPASGEIVYVNHRCAKLLGYDDGELPTQHRLLRDITQHDDHRRNAAQQKKLISGEMSEYTSDLRMRRKGGEFVHVRVNVTLLRDDTDKPHLVAMNLREFSNAEVMEHQLAAAESLAGLITWSWDAKLDRTLASSRFLYGVPKAARAPSFEEFLMLIHPEDRRAVERTVTRAIRTGLGYSHEYRVVLPNGEVHWIRGMANCLYDERGNLTHLVGALIDLTQARERHNSESASKVLRCIVKRIERDWNKDIYLADVAKECGISPRAVQRCLSSSGFVSFSKYVKQLRLRKAHSLLCEPQPNTSVLGVALYCGFQNASHFSRDYRNEFGELPSDTLRNARLIKNTP